MRIAVHKDDPGYRAFCKVRFALVYLDGVLQTDCFMADEERGEVEIFVGWGLEGEALMDIKTGVVDIIPAGVNFDAWMVARTERAHAVLMAGPTYRGAGNHV